MISCIVIEDQVRAQHILKRYINDTKGLNLKGVFGNAIDALDYLNTNTVELIFLDIHLPKISGMDFLATVPGNPLVIITTAFSEYAIKGYEYNVIDYLLKPFSYERFLKAVAKAGQLLQKNEGVPSSFHSNPANLVVKSGYNYLNINVNDIRFIKSDGDYTLLQCGQKRHLVSFPLKYWLEKLPKETFIQVHRSYIVNVQHVKKVLTGTVELKDCSIPIGRVYKKNLREMISKDK